METHSAGTFASTPAVDRILELRRRRLGQSVATATLFAAADGAFGGYAAVRQRVLAATRADMAEADRMITSVDATWAGMGGASVVMSMGSAHAHFACAFVEVDATECQRVTRGVGPSVAAAPHDSAASYVSLSAAEGTAVRVRATWEALEADRRDRRGAARVG